MKRKVGDLVTPASDQEYSPRGAVTIGNTYQVVKLSKGCTYIVTDVGEQDGWLHKCFVAAKAMPEPDFTLDEIHSGIDIFRQIEG